MRNVESTKFCISDIQETNLQSATLSITTTYKAGQTGANMKSNFSRSFFSRHFSRSGNHEDRWICELNTYALHGLNTEFRLN